MVSGTSSADAEAVVVDLAAAAVVDSAPGVDSEGASRPISSRGVGEIAPRSTARPGGHSATEDGANAQNLLSRNKRPGTTSTMKTIAAVWG